MATRMVPNGTPGRYDMKWGMFEKILVGVMVGLLTTMTIGLFRITVDVYLLNWRMAAVEKSLGIGPIITPSNSLSAPLVSPSPVAPPPKT